jgi:hypothetical protein
MTSPILVWLVPARQPAHPIEIPPGSVGAPTHPIYWPIDPGYGAPWQPPTWGGTPPPGYPAHPIAPGGPPPYPSHPIPPNVWPNPPGGGGPGIWPSPGYPSHPIYYPPGPSQGPGFPTHPIAPGGPPPSVSHPIPPSVWPNPPAGGVILPPPHVEHPIPPNIWPEPPGPPPGGETGSIENPINLPPSEAGGMSPGFWALAYFPQISGWLWVWVPVETPPPGGTHHK